MGSLREELLKKGLIGQEEATKHEKKKTEELKNEQRTSIQKSKGRIKDLNLCKNVLEFKKTAKQILLADPDRIGELLKAAHEFGEPQQRKRLVWEMYQVRDALKTCPKDKIETLLKRAFRKSNPKFTLPEK